MRYLIASVFAILCISVLQLEAALLSPEDMDKALPGFRDVVEFVHKNEPFHNGEALKLFYNADGAVQGVPTIDENDHSIAAFMERAFRFENGFGHLRRLGTEYQWGFGSIMSKKSTQNFLIQLNRELSKYSPLSEGDPFKGDWFLTSLENHLKSNPGANTLSLKEKVLGAIRDHYPDINQYNGNPGRPHYVDRRNNAIEEAESILNNYLTTWEVPESVDDSVRAISSG